MYTIYIIFSCIFLSHTNCIADEGGEIEIVGGHEISIREVPFMALYRPIGKHYHCGASIISNRFLVSAAHCYYPIPMDITVGTDKAESGGQRYEINNVTVHPLYKGHDYDVCVIEVKGTMKFSETVAPVKMVAPGTEMKNGVMLLTTGFGDTDAKSVRKASNQLLGVKVPYVDRDVCRRSHNARITERMVCAGGQEGMDSCQGDSGGSLVLLDEHGGRPMELVGMVSFGIGCGRDIPGVYTNVAAVRDFTDQVVQNNF